MKKMFILLLLFFIFPIFVNAEVTSSLTCSKNIVEISNTFYCNLTVTPIDAPIKSFKANVSYPSDFTLTSITPASNWTSNSSSIIDLTNSTYGEGEGLTTALNIVTLKFKTKSSATYGKKTISINGFDLSVASSYDIDVLSSNNLLSSLTIKGIDFDFSSITNTYNLSTAKNSVTISATLMDSNSSFKTGYGPRTVNLNYGNNTIQIVTVSESGSTNTYTINIERIDQRSDNNNLSVLKVSEGTISPTFNKNVLTYNVTVDKSVSTLAIEATKEVSSSSFVSGYGPRTVNIQDGLNTFKVQVKSEKEVSKTYTLNIIRSEESSNNYLKSLVLSNSTIDFNKNILEYEVNVLYNILEMEIFAVPEDSSAKVEVIGNKSLVIGANVFTVNVVAANESILTYKITVNRLEEGKALSNNNYLSELIVNNYNIKFNKDTLSYTLEIKDESRLSISYTPEEPTATVQVLGNNSLKDGSKININVTSEDGTLKTYVINIVKEKSGTNMYLYIILIVVLLISLLFILFRKKIFKKKETQIINNEVNLGKSKLILSNKNKDNLFSKNPEVINIPEEDNNPRS